MTRAPTTRRLCGRFTLIEQLGAGGHAEVWRARDDTRSEDIALKVLFPAVAALPHAWATLEREAKISERLIHPAILEVYEPVRDAHTMALPMVLAAGGDLRKLRSAVYTGVVPKLIELAEALNFAHARGVVHRDLKPGNVLLDAKERVKLSDFGAAAIDGVAPARQMGSPFGASPQQLRGEAPTASDDIYGFGALAYELLSGYPPFYPQFDPQRVMTTAVPTLKASAECPPRLVTLVMRMLAKTPAGRPASMSEVADELHACLSDTLTFEVDGTPDAPAVPTLAAAAVTARPSARAPALEATSPIAAAVAQRPADTSPAAASVTATRAAPSLKPSLNIDPSRDWSDIVPDISAVNVRREFARLQPMAAPRWPYALVVLLGAAVAAVFLLLPRFAPQLVPSILQPAPPGTASAAATTAAQAAVQALARRRALLDERRGNIEQRLATLDARAAGVWGGPDFAAAKAFSADAGIALEAGDVDRADQRFNAALRALAAVTANAPAALAAQLDGAEQALAAGQAARAQQQFATALKIEPNNARASAGMKRAQALDAILPLIAEAANALAAGDRERAIDLYQKALALDGANAMAQEGLQRARALAGDERYSKAVGEGLQALAAGHLDAARTSLEQAQQTRPQGREVKEGLSQLAAAAIGHELGEQRARAERAESEERWGDALREYQGILDADPSLDFARSGRTRVIPRAELDSRLQNLIDRPERLAAAEVRAEAVRLLEQADSAKPSGPVIRSQIARLELLLPDYAKPVVLAVESDNATSVSIQRVGSLGAFVRREIELTPGRYTVVGRREGFRDVRRDITVAPGQAVQVVKIACADAI
jgi:eukaryotic-like serine/threonine-protein kinase